MGKRRHAVLLEQDGEPVDNRSSGSSAPVKTNTDITVPLASQTHVHVTHSESTNVDPSSQPSTQPATQPAPPFEEPFYATTWALHAQSQNAFPEVANGADSGVDSTPNTSSGSPPAKKAKLKSNKNVHGIAEWCDEQRETFAEEKVRHKGLGNYTTPPPCCSCFKRVGDTRCTHCYGCKFLCSDCLVVSHSTNPLHVVEQWCPRKKFYDVYSLAEAGLVVQLGHDGLPCPKPRARQGLLTVLDVLGVVGVRINYCGCEASEQQSKVVQLLRNRWWPATNDEPRTVLTFNLLGHYDALNATGRVNMYNYYLSLHCLTDNTGTQPPKYRYKEFVRGVCCYTHLRNGCLAGRAHDPEGFDGGEGQRPLIVVKCLLCPRMGENTPDVIAEDKKPYYSVKIAIDGNFKAKLKNRNLLDVALQDGWAYFAPEEAYNTHVEKYGNEAEAKYCDSNFAAVDHAQTPSQKRFAVNGIVACVCSRHGYYLRHCTGDLRKGEQFSPIDFLLLSVLGIYARDVTEILITYDIACTYSVKFPTRMARYPSELQLDLSSLHIVWAVPKFHLRGHGPGCKGDHNLAFTPCIGRTHGEIVEAGWAELNSVALSTREMAPYSRHETLEGVMANINWHKTVRNGPLLVKSFNDAMEYREKQHAVIKDLNNIFPAALRDTWLSAVRHWDKTRQRPNPYEEKEPPTSLTDLKLELQAEEVKELKRGVLQPHETSGSVFIAVGLELEEQQRVIAAAAASKSAAPSERLALREKRNKLQHRIDSWRRLQDVYMPFVSRLLADHPHTLSDDDYLCPEKTPLFLPSALTPSQQQMCLGGIVEKERRLRVAQATDAVHQTRRALHIKLGLVHYKHVQAEGPSNARSSRARDLVAEHETKLNRHVVRYRACRAALILLSPHDEALERLHELKKADLKLPGPDDVGDNPEQDRRRARQERQRLKRERQAQPPTASPSVASSSSLPGGASSQSMVSTGLPPTQGEPIPSITQLRKLQSDGRSEMSWIWRTIVYTTTDLAGKDTATQAEVDESMRYEYIVQHARVSRWEEEVEMLEVEMDCGVRHFNGRARWWLSQVGSRRHQVNPNIASGLDAHARRQANNANRMANVYVKHWQPCLIKHGRVDIWANRRDDAIWDAPVSSGQAAGADVQGTSSREDGEDHSSSDNTDDDGAPRRQPVSDRIAGIQRGDDEEEDSDEE